MTPDTAEIVERQIVVRAARCGHHHDDACEGCQSAKAFNDKELTEKNALIETLTAENERMRAELSEAKEALRHIIGAANESPKFGPFDCIDNHGEPYQSADLHDGLEKGRKIIARQALSA